MVQKRSKNQGSRPWGGSERGDDHIHDPFPRVSSVIDLAITEVGYGKWKGHCPYCLQSTGTDWESRAALRRTLKSHVVRCSANPHRAEPKPPPPLPPLKDLVRIWELADELGLPESELRDFLPNLGIILFSNQKHLGVDNANRVRAALSEPDLFTE